jgi:heterodisulfide reductase subunit A
MNEDIRVGVFVCDCGSNIAGVVNVPRVVEYAKSLKDVAFADEGRWSCSVDYLASMKELIKEHSLNRVVIASCTPRTHEPLFKRTVKEAGLNPYLLEFVSIREQVSWVHRADPLKATEKAKDLVKMGVAKAVLLEEGEEIRLPVKTDCMVIGGGMAGMTTALSIAKQGFHAIIVEKEPQLGGLLNRISHISHNHEEFVASTIVKDKVDLVKNHPNITVYTSTEIEDVKGYIGNYKVTLNANGSSESLEVSTVIVATGMKEIEPIGKYEYGADPRIVTQLQLEKLIGMWNSASGPASGKEGPTPRRENGITDGKLWIPEPARRTAGGSEYRIQNVVIINCVNSKNEFRGCCNIGCAISVKNALALKRLNNNIHVHILYRDLSMVKEEGSDLETAKKAGVRFIRFPDDRYPETEKKNGNLAVHVYDILLGKEFTIPSDLLVLTTGFQGNDTYEAIKGHLKVSTNQDGFFQEAHIKLGPLDFPSDGISLCGCARSPKNLKDTQEEAMGAAMRASIPMKRGYLEAEGIVADIDLDVCNSCRLCEKNCPYGAIQWVDEKPHIIKALCKGCGLCAADCPKNAVTIIHYSDNQILAQIEAALEERPEEKIIGFVCHWCALGGVDMAGVSRLQYPPNVRLIRVMCSARVASTFIERAFELKAAGVLVAGCEFPTCHYITGNYAAEERIKKVKKRLARKGYDPDKLWDLWCSAADGPKFANTMGNMVKQLKLE